MVEESAVGALYLSSGKVLNKTFYHILVDKVSYSTDRTTTRQVENVLNHQAQTLEAWSWRGSWLWIVFLRGWHWVWYYLTIFKLARWQFHNDTKLVGQSSSWPNMVKSYHEERPQRIGLTWIAWSTAKISMEFYTWDRTTTSNSTGRGLTGCDVLWIYSAEYPLMERSRVWGGDCARARGVPL